MNMMKRANRTLIPLLLLTILVFLTIGSIMLYRFYQNQSQTEIQRERRSLDFLVFQTYHREFQRIFLITHALRQIHAETEDDLRKSLRALQDLYSPAGQFPGIVKEIGYGKAEETGIRYVLDSEQNWARTPFPGNVPPPLPPEKRETHPEDIVLYGFKGSSADQSGIFLSYTPDGQKSFSVQLEMDWDGFSELYIKPAVTEALDSYELEWKTGKRQETEAPGFNKPETNLYRFRPLAALFSRSYREDIDHLVPLPAPFLSRDPVIIDQKSAVEGETPERGQENPFFRMDREILRDSGTVLFIGYGNAPFYWKIEKENAANWLQSMIILFGMGGIFFIMAAQLARLKNLREKEKEFVASMTHELRTPLTVIRSAADNMEKGIIPAERMNQYGNLIKDQALRLGTMIEEILLFSSMEGKPVLSEAVPVDLHKITESIRAAVTPIAERQNITLYWDTEGLSPVCLGNPEIFRLGLNNLLMNALNHAYPQTPGPVRILIRPGIPDSLQIVVEDEGRGIPAGEQKKVFTPFYRDHFSRQNQEKGSGLGLFICLKKAVAAGGGLKLESPYKKLDGAKQTGCRFTLKLPCKMIREEKEL